MDKRAHLGAIDSPAPPVEATCLSQGGSSAPRGLSVARPALVVAMLLLVAAALLSASGCGSATTATSGATVTATPGERRPAPSFSGTTWAGQQVSLDAYAGKPLVLAFWASW